MKMNFLKTLFSGILTLGLIFSNIAVAFAAGGTGGGNGGGTGGSGTPDPVTFIGAYQTTIANNVSTTGTNVNGSNTVSPDAAIKLVFDKNVVNSTVWDINSKAVSMADSDGNNVAINVSRIPDEGPNSNPDEKRNIFLTPAVSLTLGKSYTITIKSSLTANNTSTLGHKETITFTVKTDITAPVLTASTAGNITLTNKEKIVVSGSTESGSRVKVNNSAVTVDDNGLFNQEITLLPGLNKIQVTFTDASDNTNLVELQITYDNAAPVLSITTPKDNVVSKSDKISVIGTSEKDATVKVNDSTTVLDSNNAFTHEVSLVKGANTITVTSTDAAGNTSVVTLHVTYDNSTPAITTSNSANGTSSTGTHTLPETATAMYNWMYAGLLVTIIGIAIITGPKLRKFKHE